jgi:hypothetical protein
MKKILCVLVVMAFAATASAEVQINCNQPVSNEPNIVISYVCTDSEEIRCLGLNIQLDNDETITAVECLSDDYYLYPGNFSYDGVNPNFGSIPCLCTGEADTLPGLDSNGVTVGMCSLYAEDDPDHNVPPASSGDLVQLTVSGEACLIITENGTRGFVDVDNVELDPNIEGSDTCCVTGLECFPDT